MGVDAGNAGEMLERTLRGEISPVTVIARRPMLHGLDWGRTGRHGPMAELLARADRVEERGEALAVSICAGFPLADIHDAGPSVTVTVNGSASVPSAQAIAEEFMDFAWRTRDYSSVQMLSVAQAVALARRGGPVEKPLVVADYTDNPGGGGYGDATAFLQGLVEGGVESVAFHAICDPRRSRREFAPGSGPGRH